MTTFFDTPVCPGTLAEGFYTYSIGTLRNLFNNRKVFHVLPWESTQDPEFLKFNALAWTNLWKGCDCYGFDLVKNKLVPNKKGDYHLITYSKEPNFRLLFELPGNLHFCLQLARQIFDIDVVNNAMIFFEKGQPALIYKKAKSEFSFYKGFQNTFKNRKPTSEYDFSFLQAGEFIERKVAAATIEKEKLFIRLLFNFLVADGEANLEHFHLTRSSYGDLQLAPLEYACCTRIHFLGPEIAAVKGFYEGDVFSPEFREYGHYTGQEFVELGKRMGLIKSRVEKYIAAFTNQQDEIFELVNRAFINDEAKGILRFHITERIKRLQRF